MVIFTGHTHYISLPEKLAVSFVPERSESTDRHKRHMFDISAAPAIIFNKNAVHPEKKGAKLNPDYQKMFDNTGFFTKVR
ncbi:MAG TPA: hypothetical protein ENJ24_04245 [Gammaproteobacteria bacterium]|nr:hypothetical protein [Gammaproteobacteria bacterium]